jgi:LPXTG-motif cell wall-anchored protein
MALAVGALLMFQGATASAGIGQGPCHHGNSNTTCKPDPQPDHGKECVQHGGNPTSHGNTSSQQGNGEGNQDHCLAGGSTPTPTPTPSTSTTVEGNTVVQGKIVKVAPKQLAKTGPNETRAAVGLGLILIGLGFLVRTFAPKEALQA